MNQTPLACLFAHKWILYKIDETHLGNGKIATERHWKCDTCKIERFPEVNK